MKSLELEVYPDRFCKLRWDVIPNGPFPVTMDILEQARVELKKRLDALPEHPGLPTLSGTAKHSMARDVLKTLVPRLSDFDRLCLSAAVTSEKVRPRGMSSDMCDVVFADGKKKKVANLGWILKRWATLKKISFIYNPHPVRILDGQLICTGTDFTFTTDYADIIVCLTLFLKRPTFMSLPFEVVNKKTGWTKTWVIGSPEFMDLYKRARKGRKVLRELVGEPSK